jgi:hypothetical protein
MTEYTHLALVRLNVETPKPIHFVIPFSFIPHEYWINESTCPSNVIGVTVIQGTDTDPHGLLKLIEVVPIPDNWEDSGIDLNGDNPEYQFKLFPSLSQFKD